MRAYGLTHGLPSSIGPYIWHDDGVAGFSVDRREQERPDALRIGPGYLNGSPNDTTARFRDLPVSEQHRRLTGALR